jgi:hypothetical protein
MGGIMKKFLISVAAASTMLTLAAAHASTYNWTYTSTSSDTASGTLTTGTTDNGGFDVTTITGTYTNSGVGDVITGLITPGTCCSSDIDKAANDNIVYPDQNGGGVKAGAGGYLDTAGLGFSVSDSITTTWVDLYFRVTPTQYDVLRGSSADENGFVQSLGTFTLVPVAATPLPPTLPLFSAGLGALGLFGWRTKRRAQAIA